MTPTQKLKWLALNKAFQWQKKAELPYPCINVDALWNEIDETDPGTLQDAKNDVRYGGEDTGLPTPSSRHYEADARAIQFPDGSWVGFTYWHGGGKHGEPEAIEWMGDAYDVTCTEEEKVITVRTFAAKKD
jgi:hypothetical protein